MTKPNLDYALKKVLEFFVTTCDADANTFNDASIWKAYGIIETNSLGFGNMTARGVYPMVSWYSKTHLM
jgi:hypothetical protein